jgi:hypothetical protein
MTVSQVFERDLCGVHRDLESEASNKRLLIVLTSVRKVEAIL